MVEYNTINVKLSNSQLNKLKRAVKNRHGTILRMNARMFNGNNLTHELLLITRQTTKLRNAIDCLFFLYFIITHQTLWPNR